MIQILHLNLKRNIKIEETELKLLNFYHSPFPLGLNDKIYHEGYIISKMPGFGVFLYLLECSTLLIRMLTCRSRSM